MYQSKRIIRHIIITLLFITSACLFYVHGQVQKKEDAIQLKSGHVIYGWILEQEPGQYVKLELVGGSILVIEQEKIEKITREPSRFREVERSYNYRLSPILYREKGPFFYLTPHFSFREGRVEFSNSTRLDVGIHMRIGYRLNRLMGIAMGVGVDNYEGGVYMPVYADISGDLLQKRVTPHYQISAGYGYGVSASWPNSQVEGGKMAFVGFGYKIHTQRNLEWVVVAGYKIQDAIETESNFRGNIGAPPTRDVRYQGLTIQVSFGF